MPANNNDGNKPHTRVLPAPPTADWLDLRGIQLDSVVTETAEAITVSAHTCITEMPLCPYCSRRERVICWDSRIRTIRHTEHAGKRVRVMLRQQRYRCQDCGKTFTPVPACLGRSRIHRTEMLTEKVQRQLAERLTVSYVAYDNGMSRRLVQHIAGAIAETMPTPQQVFLEATKAEDACCIIQVDDAHPSCGVQTTILLNGKKFELLDGYNESVIAQFFVGLDSIGRDKVSIYVSDLAPFLLSLGRKYFRYALVVADPYHVVRKIMACFDAILESHKAAILDEYKQAIRDGILDRPVRARRKSRARGTSEDQQESREPQLGEIKLLLHRKEQEIRKQEQLAIQRLLEPLPDVRAGYMYLQGMMSLYHMPVSQVEASQAFDRLEIGLRDAGLLYSGPHAQLIGPFAACVNLSHLRRNEICAFWACGWTNAETEAQNGVIKDIDRRGKGLMPRDLRRSWLYGESPSELLARRKPAVQTETSARSAPKKIRVLKDLPAPPMLPLGSSQLSLWPHDSKFSTG